MATKTSGWLCTHTAAITASTDTSVTITVTCYWKNNGWNYDINNVSAWVYCNGTSKQVKSAGSIDSRGDNYKTVSCGSATFTISKTTATQSISCYAKITSESSYVSGTKSSTAANVSVPAKTSYTVKYNANGGSGAPSSQTKWYGTTLTLSSTKPSRTGYSFQGWGTTATDTSVNYEPGESYTANEGRTLYAIWKANIYTVSYDANGGSGAPKAQTKTYGLNLTLSTTIPTRTNYNFLGWGTSKTSTTASYAAGASYTANAAITLYAVWELAYKKPRITKLTVSRCRTIDGETTLVDDGTSALVSFNWASDKTITSITLEWRLSSSTTWGTPVTITASGTSGSVSHIVGSDDITSASALSTENTYDFRVTVKDSESSQDTVSLPGMVFPIDVLARGRGVAFGKPAELENMMDVGFDGRFRKNLYLDQGQYLYAYDSANNVQKNVFQAMNENGNTVIGFGNYDNDSGNTNIYGYDVVFGVSNIASKNTYRPYRRRGDTLTFSLRTAGYVTNGGKDVTFTIFLAEPIIGSPTATLASVNGFTLRQDNKYTHGSSATAYAIPTEYAAETVATYMGIHVVARFSDTTNVINNAPIGIYWSGTVTFS